MERAWHKQLFSLSGIVPLGFFLLEHTWQSASAMRGQTAYEASVESLTRLPLLVVLEMAFVFAPLGYHALYGAWMMREALPKGAPPYNHRALALANRGAAFVALAFIVWHVWTFRVHAWRYGLAPSAFYSTLVWQLSSTWHGFPVRASLWLIGVLAVTFHFAVSTWGYGVTSGFLSTRLQKRQAAVACLALGALLFVVSASTLISLATGAAFSPSATESTPCTKK